MLKLSKAEFSVILLIFILFFSVIALFDQARRASDDVIERAFSSAGDLVEFVMVANRNYMKSVSGLPIEELTAYPEQEPHKAWLPATYALSYTQDYSAKNPGVDFRIYSRDPFSTNRDRVLDGFASDALDALLPGGAPSYRVVEELEDGYLRVRLARPFEMDENCVACHNRPEWGLQNQNWEVGDVRGIWEASVLVDPVNLHTPAEMVVLFTFIAIACFLGVFIVFPATRREVKSREFFHDRSVSMEKKANLNLLKAHTDALTRIGNRRFFDSVIEPMVKDHRRDGEPLAVIIFDIDFFKSINDTYGHDAGDLVIKSVASILRRNIRNEDKLARLGGEEFVVIVPGLGHGEVRAMAMRIKDDIEAHKFRVGPHDLRVTISAGIAFLGPDEGADALMKRADELLYHAKNTGRNKVCDRFHTVPEGHQKAS